MRLLADASTTLARIRASKHLRRTRRQAQRRAPGVTSTHPSLGVSAMAAEAKRQPRPLRRWLQSSAKVGGDPLQCRTVRVRLAGRTTRRLRGTE
jgi:hypothetical protein